MTLTLYEGEHTALELPIRKLQRYDETVIFERPEIAQVIEIETIRIDSQSYEKYDIGFN